MKDFRAFDVFKEEGEWYRGNLHSHTINSDGDATPEELVSWYQRNGYDFLAITDHDVITDVDKLDGKGMLLIPGLEFGYDPEEEPTYTLDMLGINIRELPAFLDPDRTGHVKNDPKISPQQIIDHLNEIGGMAIMCHPYFMINMTEPYLKYQGYVGMEAYNYVCEEQCGRGHHEIYWDTMLMRGKRIMGFATDDSHKSEFGHAWIEVKAKEKTVPAILEAIREGRFYATAGIQIFDLEYTDDKVRITFDRPCDVVFMPGCREGWIVRSYQNEYTLVDGRRRFSAEATVNKDLPYLRIELIDANGLKAYTNPVYFK